MTESSRRIAIVLVVLTAILGVAVAISVAAPSSSHGPSSVPPSPVGPVTQAPQDWTVRAFHDFTVLPGAPIEPVGRSLQSRLWTIDGVWWAAMVEPVSRETRIHQLSLDGSTWSDTGVLLDERAGAMADVLWSAGSLYVASAVPGRSTSNGVRISRFSREPGGRFVLDQNFPVRLTERGVTAASFARDTDGRLWAAFVQDGRVLVAHSADDEAVWGAPSPVVGPTAAVGPADVAALVADGAGRLGLVWSDVADRSVLYSSRGDREATDRWSQPEIAFEGLPLADEPLSVASGGDGPVFVAVDTVVAADPAARRGDPGSIILARDPAGSWRSALISRVVDHLGQPIVLVDRAAQEVYVFATTPRRGGAVRLKRAGVDRLDFPVGRGVPVIVDPSDPTISFLTSAKQSIDVADGLVVLGFDGRTGSYWHALIGPAAGTATPPAPSSDGGRPSPSPTGPAPLVTALFTDDFDPWPEDGPIGNGWEIGPTGARGSLTAVGDVSTSGQNAYLQSATASAVRACKSFAPISAGTLRAEVRVRLDGIGPADAVITSLRDRGGEAASVRYGQGGTFAYYAGPTKVRSPVPIRLKTWYRSVVTVYPKSRTYDWRLADDDGAVVLRLKGISFRDAAATPPSELCVQTSAGADTGIRFDDVRVSR